jgi:transposase
MPVRFVHVWRQRTTALTLTSFAGVDPGIIHPFAVVSGGEALLVSGRGMRAECRLHLADTKARGRKMGRKTPGRGQRGSRRWRKLRRSQRRQEARHRRRIHHAPTRLPRRWSPGRSATGLSGHRDLVGAANIAAQGGGVICGSPRIEHRRVGAPPTRRDRRRICMMPAGPAWPMAAGSPGRRGRPRSLPRQALGPWPRRFRSTRP